MDKEFKLSDYQISFLKFFAGVFGIIEGIVLIVCAMVIALCWGHLTMPLIVCAIIFLAGLLISVGITLAYESDWN
jgi:hypothetical protein